MLCAKVSRSLDLVYGGGSIGLMGLVSQAVHSGGGNVLGYYTITELDLAFMGFTSNMCIDVLFISYSHDYLSILTCSHFFLLVFFSVTGSFPGL